MNVGCYEDLLYLHNTFLSEFFKWLKISINRATFLLTAIFLGCFSFDVCAKSKQMFYFCVVMFYKCFTEEAMATFKQIILPHHRREDGTYNVKIRITHNRKTKYLKTPYYVGGSDVSRRKRDGKEELKIKNQAVIDALDSVILEYRRRLLPLGMEVDAWDIDRLISFLSSNPDTFALDIIGYTRAYGERLIKEGREGTGKQYLVMANALVRFVGSEVLDISEITGNFLRAFENHLKNEPVFKHTTADVIAPIDKRKTGASIHNYLSKIRTVYEMAKVEFNDEDNGIINIPWSPFSRYKIPPMPVAEHRVLTIEQVQKVIDFQYSGKDTIVDLGKDMFLLSFCLMGINTADLYEVEVDGDILAYERRKTRTRRNDRAKMEVRIEPEIRGLVAKYLSKSRVIDIRKKYRNIMTFNAAVNKGLNSVGDAIGVDGLSFYYARHTMASLCANVLGVDIARVDEMLNHSDSRLKMARVYIQRDFKPLWDANRRLLDLFDWSSFLDCEKK